MAPSVSAKRLTSLPAKYYELIGEVMFHWALNDAQIAEMIGIFLGMAPKEQRLLVGRLDEKQKIMMLRFLAERAMRPRDPIRKALTEMCKLNMEMADRRHQFAHSPWVKIPGAQLPAILDMGSVTKRYFPNAQIMTDEKILDSLLTFRMLTENVQLILKALEGQLLKQAQGSSEQASPPAK